MYQGNRNSRPRFGGAHRPNRTSNFRGGPGGFRQGRGEAKSTIDISRLINKVAITEEVEVYVAEHTFADFLVDERLKKNIIDKGYLTPTPIQDKIIPHILQGQDVVGIANTGTGKTAAFVVPLLHKVLKNPKEKILIMAPTRELAIQIETELKSFATRLGIHSVVCVGGAPIGRQIADLRHPNHFVIGTPGRLKDLIERRVLNLSSFATVVLDEADRMLDMGFINDMRYIIGLMQKERHTLFFSATLSHEIEKLIQDFLKDPVRISVKTQDTSKDVYQDVVRIKPGENKVDVLHNLLKQADFCRVLVFGKTKHGVERLAKTLAERGLKADSIHGNKTHNNRQRALLAFKTNQVQVLVATDVAARGLDISDISHVINFDLPTTYDDYVHRIGRTGRAGKKGKALSFV
ncbi:MAG: hypothetical protein A2571_03600 [Candidatus Vogelbacteria bacterium RIFOXYD1_FULL_44_32]|uniref:RNA helicase n=1 Tax=Candidatus Vogelbacteria bacterium RIFOXYD1_FULL_44_32 TaxID=1802438 RepID=A0A1G2QCI3_9BACT|nr:MAG: hypothetical protein A2571_03600 [Candidatus Vogelbacteria bacterium RIFOXYD1_FULL_44_32]